MRERLELILKQGLEEISSATVKEELENARIKYLGKKGGLTQIPVSYTHLDVYKRQGMAGISGTLIVKMVIAQITGISINIPAEIFIKCAALSMLCGIVCGIVPANKASKFNPIDIIVR